MRGLTHRWNSPTEIAQQPEPAGSGVHALVARFLHSRGITAPEAIHAFCNPRLAGLHDPSRMPDLDAAANLILDTLRAGRRIVIYGDYDVDGICASTILFHMLKRIGGPDADVATYVPHRLDEGYGVHAEALEQLAAEGASLVITVDCGITAFAAADRARELGLELIITDHHNLSHEHHGEVPKAAAVVHPRRPGSEYPFGDLCGAGVAFKIAWRLATLAEGKQKVGEPMRALLLDLLALAALATVADVVPLVDENRIITRFGLAHLRRSTLPGVRALLEASGLSGESIGAEEAGFALGPRLNACGRMGHAREAVEMLTVATPERALAIARELNRQNDERRATERRIFEHACRLVDERGMAGGDSRAIVLADAEWHAGVVGIVCSRLVGRYHRPAILMQQTDGQCHGSGRSIDGFDLHAALAACSGHLDRYGGHDMAAGLALSGANLDAFRDAFNSYANEHIGDEMLIPSLRIDCEATLSDFELDAVTQLLALGPFGRGNPRPNILVKDLNLIRDAEPMGERGRHLALHVRQGAKALRMIGWHWGEHRSQLRGGSGLQVVVCPKLNQWNGRTNVEAEIRDVCPQTALRV